jgi:transcriptional regulator with XRE-family HTH domain
MVSHTLSPQTREALRILAASIRAARLGRGWTEADLAERVGVSRPTIVNLEAGRSGVAIGTVLEAATLVGVPLFSDDAERRTAYGALKSAELALLPDTARPRRAIDDNF